MKGLLYSYFTLYKHLWMWSVVVLVAVSVGGFVMITMSTDPANTNEELVMGTVMFIQLAPLIAPFMLSEGQNRCVEQYIHTRFLNYQLSGTTTHRFMLTELVKSLTATVAGIAMVALQLGVFLLADKNSVIVEIFVFQMVAVIAGNAITWLCLPLTIIFKSQEKAGLIVGVIAAAAIIYPMIKMFESMNENGGMIDMYSFFNDPVKVLCTIGVCVVVYALFYLVTYKVIKRGDMC